MPELEKNPDPMIVRLRAVYGHRRRQVIVVSIMGFVGLVFSTLGVVQLPRYVHSLCDTQDGRLYLVAQLAQDERLPQNFLFTHSSDGNAFAPPQERTGKYVSAVAFKGRLYCLFADGSLTALGASENEDAVAAWRHIPASLAWKPLGLAAFDNQLIAFGQDDAHTRLVTATLENDAWQDGADIALAADNILFVAGCRAQGKNVLYWLDVALAPDAPKASQLGVMTTLKPDDFKAVRQHAAEWTSEGLKDQGSMPLETLIGATFTGDETGLHVFYTEGAFGIGDAGRRPQEGVFHVDWAGGKWGHPVPLTRPGRAFAWSDDFAAGNVGGKTFLYSFDYWMGLLYRGCYGAEVRGDALSGSFLVMGPLEEEMRIMFTWMVSAIAAFFLAAGGVMGMVRLSLVTEERSPLPDRPIFASVTDRAAACGMDFALVYTFIWLFMRNADIGTFWVSFAFAAVVYGTAAETVLKGQTLGKRLLGLRVLDTTGVPVSGLKAFQRNLLKPIEALTVGVGCCLVTRRFQRPGDLLAGTVVVKEFLMPRRAVEE